MSERRAHWTDELIARVDKAVWDDTPAPEYVYGIIAIVEDWQVANARGRIYLAEPTSAEQAAIARVREFREELAEWVGGSLSVERVLHDLDTALEGDSDD